MPSTTPIRVRCGLLCCFAVLACAELHAQTGTITTVAGNGTACAPTTAACGDGGPATSANLNSPTGVAFDLAGNIFIADSGSNRIRRVDATTGTITTVAGNGTACAPTTAACGDGGPAASANLTGPTGVAIDSAGDIFIADTGDNKIRRVDATTGIINTVAGNGTACTPSTAACGDGGVATSANLSGPTTVVVAGLFHDLLIADSVSERVRFVNGNSTIISTVAGNGTPCAPATAACGDGGAATSANLNQPNGVVFDPLSNQFLADTNDNRIRRVDATALTISTIAGNGTLCVPTTAACGDGGPATSASLNLPTSVLVDRFGNRFIGDTGSSRIRRADASTGNISTVAGNGTPGFSGDGGPATSASLNAPHGIALDKPGNLFIADTGNNRIRRVVGIVTPSSFVAGQVFAAVGSFSTNAVVEVFNPNGTLVQILDTGLPGLPGGLAFDKSGTLYVTDFNAQNVTRFDHNGMLLGNFGSGYNRDPESILQSPGGNFFVGQADGSHQVLEFDPMGNPVMTFSPAVENRGTDWIELQGDRKTLLYTSEGHLVKSFDISMNTQNPNFATGLPGAVAYALKILPDGTILVADTASVVRLNASGTIIPPTYTPPGTGLNLFALNLDPNGINFWTADILTGIVYEFDIVSGNPGTSFHAPLPPGATSFLQGLAIFGEKTPGTADLSVTKTSSANPVTAGSPLMYTVTVANGGPVNATGVMLTDTLPGAVTFNSVSSSQGTCSGTTTITCNLGSLNNGAQATVMINVTVNANAPSPITNTANVMGNEPDPNLLNNTAMQTTNVVAPLTVTLAGTGSGTVMSNPAGINCPTACSASFSSGSMVMLMAVPATGSTFTSFSNNCLGTGSSCSVTMNGAQAVTATFTATTTNFKLTVKEAGNGSGTVTGPSGINCPTTCSASFAPGTMVTLTATAATNSTFAGWDACTGTGTCTVTMNSDQTVTATFTLNGGVNFTLGPANGSGTTATVHPGDTAVFLLSLSSVNGFTGKVTLTCASSQPSITCSIMPSMVTLGPGITATMITVNTFCAWVGPWFGPPDDLPGPWLPALGVLLALTMMVAVTGVQRRKLRVVSPLAALALFAISMAGCASVPHGPSGATPPGTYNLVITATAPGSAPQSIPLTLKVL